MPPERRRKFVQLAEDQLLVQRGLRLRSELGLLIAAAQRAQLTQDTLLIPNLQVYLQVLDAQPALAAFLG